MVLPPSRPLVRESARLRQAEDQLNATNVNEQPGKPLGNSGPQATSLSAFTLPRNAVEIDTKTEQEKLLAKVEQALRDFPQDAAAYHIAAITYKELLQTDKAATLFERSLALNSRDPQVLVGYSDLLLQVGKHEQAVNILSEPAASPMATAEICSSLGNAYLQLGELEKALEVLGPASKKFPTDSMILLRLAQTQLQLDQFDEAVESANRVIASGREDNTALTTLSSALMQLGRREEALKVRAQASASTQKDLPKEKLYQQTFQRFASHTYMMLANVYSTRAQLSDAQQLLMTSIELEPNAAASLVAFADLLYKQKRVEDAIQVYNRLLEVQPENIFNYNNLASLAVSVGNVPLAEDTLRRAAKADASGNSNLRLADFLIRIGKYADAASEAEMGVQRLGSADAYIVWATALKAAGRTAEAMNAVIKGRLAIPGDERLKDFNL